VVNTEQKPRAGYPFPIASWEAAVAEVGWRRVGFDPVRGFADADDG
jgi:hypothetical protein